MAITPGWHTIPLRDSSPAPSALAYVPESRSRTPDDEVEVILKRKTSITGRGAVRAFHVGDRARLPESLARAMYAAGTVNTTDPKEPERRGFVRLYTSEGHETRLCRKGVMTLPAG